MHAFPAIGSECRVNPDKASQCRASLPGHSTGKQRLRSVTLQLPGGLQYLFDLPFAGNWARVSARARMPQHFEPEF